MVLTLYKHNPTLSVGYVLPLPVKESGKVCYVTGYPGNISEQKFIEDYARTEVSAEKAKDLYAKVSHLMGGFQSKVLSTGIIYLTLILDMFLGFLTHVDLLGTLEPSNGMYKHRCPTMRGVSGGVVGILDESSCTYFAGLFTCYHIYYINKHIGVHVGGNVSMQNNYMISSGCDEFVLEYAYQVCLSNPAFTKANHAHLKNYFHPYSTLLSAKISGWTTFFNNL